MNRTEEYQALLAELDADVPGLDTTLDRAYKKRNRRRNLVLRPLTGIAACFALFVLLVNFCAPVAYACSLVPGLRELAEAVTFSRSLSDAVENEYVQPISLTQEENGITASVEYLIVDQKQINVFFRLDSDIYENLSVDPDVRASEGGFVGSSIGLNDWNVPNGELQSVTIDFVDEDVPDKLRLTLNIRTPESWIAEETAPANSGDPLLDDNQYEEPEFTASFDFLLEFDPEFTAAGKVYPVNQTVTLEGQAITITDLAVYPTHLRVNIAESEENTAWLRHLYFYIETDWGMKFEAVSNGITATGSTESPSMVSYRADSTYFYEAEHLKIVITGAEWLNKDMETVYVNLATGQTGQLPEGVALHSITREGGSWILEFEAQTRKENAMHQLFSSNYFDAGGTEYWFHSWSSEFGETDEDGIFSTFTERFPLKDYPYDEVWLSPSYSHVWTAEDLIVVIVQ